MLPSYGKRRRTGCVPDAAIVQFHCVDDFDGGNYDHWRLLLIEGVVLVILGLPRSSFRHAGFVATVFLGWLLLWRAPGLFSTVQGAPGSGFLWSLLSALAAVIAGGVLLWSPLRGMVALTLVLTAFFFVDGVLMIFLAPGAPS